LKAGCGLIQLNKTTIRNLTIAALILVVTAKGSNATNNAPHCRVDSALEIVML